MEVAGVCVSEEPGAWPVCALAEREAAPGAAVLGAACPPLEREPSAGAPAQQHGAHKGPFPACCLCRSQTEGGGVLLACRGQGFGAGRGLEGPLELQGSGTVGQLGGLLLQLAGRRALHGHRRRVCPSTHGPFAPHSTGAASCSSRRPVGRLVCRPSTETAAGARLPRRRHQAHAPAERPTPARSPLVCTSMSAAPTLVCTAISVAL